MIMNMKSLIMSLGLLALLVALRPVDVKAEEQENAILAQVLQRQNEDGGFTVVSPTTAFGRREPNAANIKKNVKDKIRIEGYDIGPLVDKLIEKNKERTPLSLKSSPEKGYIVDYDGKFKKYFDEGGGGWEKWYKDNPAAHGDTQVMGGFLAFTADKDAGRTLPAFTISSPTFIGQHPLSLRPIRCRTGWNRGGRT